MRRALAFLTPFGGARTPSPAALSWFGVVGALVGLAVGVVWWLAAKAWAAPLAAAIAVTADVAFTGYLHMDGLADAADGLLPPLEPGRRLEVMSDPAVGAFGVVTVGLFLLLRYSAFASVSPAPLVVASLWCGSRTTMAALARAVPYARPQGIASAFIEPAPAREELEGPGSPAGNLQRQQGLGPIVTVSNVVGILLALFLAVGGRQGRALAALAAELLAMAAVMVLSKRRIGGFTGDVLGAAGVVGETVGLLVLAAKW